MKKKSKSIILVGLIFTMLFGNVFTVSAEENKENVNDTEDYFYTGEIPKDESGNYVYFFYGRASKSNDWYRFQIKSEKKIAVYSEFVEEYIGKTVTAERFWLCGYSFSFGDYVDKWQADSKLTHADYYDFVYYDGDSDKYLNDDPFSMRVPPYKVYSDSYAIEKGHFDFFTTTAPIFKTSQEAMNYLKNGDDSGIINKGTTYDKSLGYLHDLHHKKLVTKTSEEGFPLESTDKFTWSDSYPDYDKTYKVDLYVICNVQERSMWLPWKKKTFSSSRTYVKSGLYKDLEFGVTNDELNAIFSSFHSPDGNSNSIFKVRSWNYDFYFRIVKDGKHGPWTIWKHTGEVLDGEVDGSVSVGEEDENGNIILIPDTEYGQGMPDDTEIGVGDDEKDAEDNIGQDQFEIKDILSWVDWFFNTLKLFISSMKDLPSLFASIFSFLPSPIVFLLSAVIVVIIILRILGR